MCNKSHNLGVQMNSQPSALRSIPSDGKINHGTVSLKMEVYWAVEAANTIKGLCESAQSFKG